MVDDAFKLPQASYEAVTRIVHAYAQIGKKTNLTTVARIVGTDPGEVSRNVGFLVSVGLLEGGRDKGPTPAGTRLGRAVEFPEMGEAGAVWREVLAGQTLIQRIIAAIRVRGGMDPATLQTQIVYTAGADKTARSMAGAAAVVEMMKVANLITERDGQYIAVNVSEPSAPTEVTDDYGPLHTTSVPVIQRVVETTAPSGVSVSVKVVVTVSATPEQLPGLGDQVRELLRHLGTAEGRSTDVDVDADLP